MSSISVCRRSFKLLYLCGCLSSCSSPSVKIFLSAIVSFPPLDSALSMYFCKHSCGVFLIERRKWRHRLRLSAADMLSSHATSCQLSNFQPESCHTPASAKAQSALHADALSVRQGHAAVQVARPRSSSRSDQARQHGRAHRVRGCRCQIDGQLRIPVVCRALHECGARRRNPLIMPSPADEIRKPSRRFADTACKRLSRRHIIFKT